VPPVRAPRPQLPPRLTTAGSAGTGWRRGGKRNTLSVHRCRVGDCVVDLRVPQPADGALLCALWRAEGGSDAGAVAQALQLAQ